jgi:hypothetical protein
VFRALLWLSGHADDGAPNDPDGPRRAAKVPAALVRDGSDANPVGGVVRPGDLRDLGNEFLRSLDDFENLMTDVIASRLGQTIADHMALRDTVAFLEDFAIMRSPDRTRWAICLGVRRRMLLGDGNHGPGQQELTHSLTIMKDLQANISSQGNGGADPCKRHEGDR